MKLLLLNTALSCLLQPGYHLRSARRRAQQDPSAEAGLTLLECVVAIAVIALTGAMIGPPLVMAAATRIQNRRAEQALQIAQGEIDRVRAMVVRGEGAIALLPDESTKANLEEESGPDALSGRLRSPAACNNAYDPTDTTHVPAKNQVLAVDIDGDCEEDFLMQVFRFPLEDQTGLTNARDFEMMVRVYSESAEEYLSGTLDGEAASLTFTSSQGDYWKKPLAVITSRITQSDTDEALDGYHGLN